MKDNKKALKESYTNNTIIAENSAKKSFLLYTEQQEVINELSNDDAGKLLKAIYNYASDQIIPDFDGILKFVFIPIRQQIDRNNKKYEETKEKRRMAGSKGGKQRALNLAKQANATFAKQIKQVQANQADNVNVNVNDNVNVNIKENSNKTGGIYECEYNPML